MREIKRILVLICCVLIAVCALVACRPQPEAKIPKLNYLFVDFVATISLEFDNEGKIIDYKAYDNEGENTLNEFSSLNGMLIEDFTRELLGLFAEKDYYSADYECIIFTSSSTALAQKKLSHVSVIYEEFAYSQGIQTEALYQVSYFNDDQLLKAINEDGISVGKLALLYELNPQLTDNQILEKVNSTSITDLLLDAYSLPNVHKGYFLLEISDSALIDSAAAKNVALTKLKEEGLDLYYTVDLLQMDVINTTVVWSIELSNNGDVYCFNIDASTGNILHYETRIHSTGSKVQTDKSCAEILNTALEDADLTEEDIYSYSITVEKEANGLKYYLVRFKTQFSEFSYKINGDTAQVINCDYRSHDFRELASKHNIISETTAIEAVNNKAIVTNVSMLTVRLYYDGDWIYFVDFYVKETFYTAEVNARSATIMEYNVNGTESSTEEDYISTTRAKSVAYEMAGKGVVISDSDVQDLSISLKKIKLDGETITVYEIKFVYNEEMYHYRVNAFDGIVIYENRTQIEFNDSFVITQEDAVKIVENKVGAPNGALYPTITYKAKNGRDSVKYKIEFHYGDFDYYFVVDADTGSIIEYNRGY